jgi:hypothetical protein
MNTLATFRTLLSVASLGVLASAAAAQEPTAFRAAGWIQHSYIGASSETARDLDGLSLYGSGAQFTLARTFSDRFRGEVGLGVAFGHTLNGSVSFGGYAPSQINPYIAQANFSYDLLRGEANQLRLRAGFFDYAYNPDVKNLGAYLLRGPVYPGVLVSGFETKHVLPVANTLGALLSHEAGAFRHDLLITSETELAPFYDLSLAYIANYRLGKALRVGAGVNFYHLIPIDGKTTRGEAWATPNSVMQSSDTIGFAGTKLMANASIDFKAFIGDFGGRLGGEDLKLYGEVALIGLNNDSAHEALYGGYAERMPVMVGFNLPTGGLLEHLSVEVEWYGSKLRDDLTGYNHTSGVRPSPLPAVDPADPASVPSETGDDIKWSVHGAYPLAQRVKLSFQVANDHLRPGLYAGDGDNNPPGQQAVLKSSSDWYTSLKLAYFF